MSCLSRAGLRLRVAVTALLAVALLLSVVGASPATANEPAAAAATAPRQAWGVYSGPAAKNVAGAHAFAAATGLPITGVVDFPPEASWADLTGPSWLLNPYTGSGLALEYSLPLLPEGVAADGTAWTLKACASGAYNSQWSLLGRNLVAASLPATIVRPGWEFNGAWFRWSAAGRVADFVGCFRNVVSTMRAVPGSRFTFDWNPNIGSGAFPAEQAYPGDDYVDVIGLDVYDLSWTWYPTPAGVTTDAAHDAAWAWLSRGDHGLTFWSAYANRHAKPLSITEWGVTWRADGHGGDDDPAFVDRMLGFITDPANHVVSNNYFNTDTADVRHDLTRSDTIFPTSFFLLKTQAARYAAAEAKAAATAKAKAKAKAKARKKKKQKARRRRARERAAARHRG